MVAAAVSWTVSAISTPVVLAAAAVAGSRRRG
jgi:hypothetical protein